jgi:crotonobetainyl-CoA:carnitine CoA-transferase CaiB-like acyl-CoA transferase
MGDQKKTEGLLSPYRALDLTDEKGLRCGKLLADLGVDVIKIEKPGGDPARRIGPFYHDEADSEKSLFWFAFNTNKRGITLDIEQPDGQAMFKELVRRVDFVIESFAPGYLDEIGLGYSKLEELNPGLIMVSITPFGQTGPYSNYKSPDIVSWAMGGIMHGTGDIDCRPLRISHPCQSYIHAASEAAAAAMVALQFRQMTGQGQQVDVSIQECVARITAWFQTCHWDMVKLRPSRGRQHVGDTPISVTRFWRCRDGHISFHYFGGGSANERNTPLVRLIDAEGIADDFFTGFDWDALDMGTVAQDTITHLEAPIRKFFLTRSKSELMEEALKYRVMLCPVFTTEDIVKDLQLKARNFWVELQHPELGTSITYPGAFAHASKTPPIVSHRAPLIGEHNHEIYEELRVPRVKLAITGRATGSQMKVNWQEEEPSREALKGIKVVDFTWAWAGPIATKTLSDHGAEVIKIESTTRPDICRTLPPFKDGTVGLNRGVFNQDNTGKLSLTINLADPRGVEIVKRLVARADIVVENSAAGALARMGLGYDELRKIKPDIVMLSCSMMGQTGPWATHRGYGYLTTAISGFTHITGWQDREMAYLDSYTDFIAPHYIVLLVLAALDYRRRTGEGQYVDLSQHEISVQFMEPLILDYTANRRIAERVGNRYPYAAPHGAYRCRGEDRWCAIAIFTDEEWKSFSEIIGNPGWTQEDRFNTLPARKQNEDELDALVEEWTSDHSAEEVMTTLQVAGVAAGVLETGEDLLEHDPQLRHRHYFWELEHPEIGKYYAPRPSFILSKTPCELRSSPLLGEHNEYILKNILDISDDEMAELVIKGVIE